MLHPTAPVVIYQPTVAEVCGVTASAAHRWPTLANRIGKAGDILLSGALTLEPVAWEVRCGVHWHIKSQTHDKAAYIVPGHSMSCPCQDRAPHAYGTRFCKHAIAVASYGKILRNHFNADVRNREIDLGILPDGTFNAYASRLGICHIRKSGATYDFVDAASAVRYSLWLAAQQQPVPVEWPIAQDVAVAA